MKKLLQVLLCMCICVTSSANQCEQLFTGKRSSLLLHLRSACGAGGCTPSQVTRSIYRTLSHSEGLRQAKAYSALIAVMVGTSSLTVAVSARVGENYPFLSDFLTIFIGQVMTLGVVVAGAPIWEPMSSKVREYVYEKIHPPVNLKDENRSTNDQLESLFFQTNSMLSLNAQWSRSVLRDYLQVTNENLYFARKNLEDTNDYHRVASQVLEILLRLRQLFPEVDPQSPLIADAVYRGFASYLESPERLLQILAQQISEKDLHPDVLTTVEIWLSHRDSSNEPRGSYKPL